MHVKPWRAGVVAAVALVALASSATADAEHDYANQTPYGTPDESIKSAPQGYEMFFLETIGRHGARALTNDKSETGALEIWERAKQQGGLTENGKTFGRDIKLFQEAEQKIGGYGQLSGLGEDEWKGVGRRNAETYADFFAALDKRDEKVVTYSTSVNRTKESAEALHQGLADAGLNLTSELSPITVADSLLRFHNEPSSAGEATTDEVLKRDAIREHAVHVLQAIYVPEFVKSIEDPLDAAMDVYKLYSTAPGMAKETNITFARYVPAEDREPLSYATDVETFYQYGPGVEGETNTVDKARPLLADFFTRLDLRMGGSSTAVVYRLAHGETTMPFAALIKAPGSDEQVPEGERFTRQSNTWRGAIAGQLAGNIEWAAYRNDDDRVLVTMRYNETPVPFNDSCKPSAEDDYFYELAELKRCLG